MLMILFSVGSCPIVFTYTENLPLRLQVMELTSSVFDGLMFFP